MGCAQSRRRRPHCRSGHGHEHELESRPQQQPHDRPKRGRNISQPQGGLQLVPAPQRDQEGNMIHHQEHHLTRDNLQQALHYVAEYTNQRNRELCIVAVGGAVNTLLLQSRDATHDVDFFDVSVSRRASHAHLLRAASDYAVEQSYVPLGGNWLNNSTILYVPKTLQEDLLEAAVTQNAVVFHEPGLKVQAAPWEYCMCAKVDRMNKAHKRSYDSADAARYLRKYLQSHHVSSISEEQIMSWATEYNTVAPRPLLLELNTEYNNHFKQDAIEFSDSS